MRHKKLTLKESWIWEGEVAELVKQWTNGKTLNVCCGTSKLGDVRVDINPQSKGIIKADMRELPFNDNTFDAVVSDPPWNLNHFKRMKPFFECVRVCKIGGKIIYNARWLPTSKVISLEKVYIRQSAQFANVSIISIFTKMEDTP